jgi:hypothetical protein
LTIILRWNFNCSSVTWDQLLRRCWILDLHNRRRHKSVVQSKEVIWTGLTVGCWRSRYRDWRDRWLIGIESINKPAALVLFRFQECGGRRWRIDWEEENPEARGRS